MPRGGHRSGYPYGVPDREKTTIKIPKEIKEEVEEAAHEIWKKRKRSQLLDDNKLPDTDDS
ncbi:hypothetical protein [Okeania sp. SIO2B3]|uniref:hypothetical protein n=1 Tax=Okeania sp. SIO2B3 TaxID=2607784 RepID=UPI0013C11820|nr:hypothetical protein [Okeania sp. SIO2B3]NET40568.1 hypothetical protein [Okeania sp. SIO2B3]